MNQIKGTGTQLRIGILTKDIEHLGNWEYRILEYILNHPNLELCLFIKDGRKELNSLKSIIKRNLITPKVITNILYEVQMKIESFVLRQKSTVDVDDIIHRTKEVETVYLKPERRGFLDIFSKKDSEMVKSYGLDIILRHEFNIIRGDILSSAKYGVWSFHHADNAINRGGPAGFWEIVNKEPYCGATLQQLTPELDGGLVIDKARFNRHWSFYKTNHDLLEKSVILLFKNIDLLIEKGEVSVSKSLTYWNRLYRKPNLGYLLLYMFRFYMQVLRFAGSLISPGRRNCCWSLFVGKGHFLEATLFRIKPVAMPKDVFWADPFLYRHNDRLYVFFENYSYKKKKGIISVGQVIESGKNTFSVTEVQTALSGECHLSYPNVFEEDNEIFLIPEAHGNKRLEIYRCKDFPCEWELYATAFEGENIIDTTYFRDDEGGRWLFINKGIMSEYSELYIYKIDNLKLTEIKPHKLNPVIIDCREARNGGGIFKYNDEFYRPNQKSTNAIYGSGLRISKIKKLTIDEFEDEEVISTEPNFCKNLVGMHHVHQSGDIYVFDACFKKL